MINNLKDLAKLISLCQKTGVETLKIGDLELKLGPIPIKAKLSLSKRNEQPSSFDPGAFLPMDDRIITDEMTEEQKLFGSSDPSVWNEKQ